MCDVLKRIENERKSRILKTGETFEELSIYCPYCAEENYDAMEGLHEFYNDEWTEIECYHCGKIFKAKWTAVYSTEQKK